jgi:hypothetical protein
MKGVKWGMVKIKPDILSLLKQAALLSTAHALTWRESLPDRRIFPEGEPLRH